MKINLVKFDMDVCKKVDKILSKHQVKFSYTNYIKKLKKEIKGDMRYFVEDFGRYDWVNFPKFKNLQKYKGKIDIADDFSILQISSGFITRICLPPKIEEITDFEHNEWGWFDIESMKDLDDKLTLIETRLEKMIKFYYTPDIKIMMESFAELKEEANKIEEKKNELKVKINKQCKKVINITNDF